MVQRPGEAGLGGRRAQELGRSLNSWSSVALGRPGKAPPSGKNGTHANPSRSLPIGSAQDVGLIAAVSDDLQLAAERLYVSTSLRSG